MTNAYIDQQYGQLSTTMGGDAGTLERGIDLYNRQQYAEAEALFARQLDGNCQRVGSTLKGGLGQTTGSDRLLKLAGLAALQRQKYDLAIQRFHQLGERTDLFSNPGLFLEALARLRRNEPMNKEQAKKLLNEVISRNLEGKAEVIGLTEQVN